ncbi:Gfo/Idh/MocA family oxidoreductase [Singulisphaera sp. Ch08]|uniref:Gfo/Idh/MocA family oxidoreductase n=1 Tax=Singulisphaera sp. Ch08 TaxID=3120278 RepID=A0AAU7CA68_9BACT
MNGENRRAVIKRFGGALACSLTSGLANAQPGAARPAQPRIKIGQIGVGHAHASKLSVFRQSADYEVVGIVEPDAELRRKAEAQAPYRDLKWMSQEQLLNAPGVQAILVETRVRNLLDTAEACVEAGKHIHLDKPAGESLPQYRRILDAAAKRNLLVQMGYMYRYNPAVVLLRDLLKRGWLGDVFEVHAVMSKVVDPAARRELAEYRGGIMFELGCHIIDLVVGALGKPTKVTPFSRHAGSRDDALLDNMLAVFEYPRALATVKSTAMEVDGGERRHLVVCGTEGTFQIQPLDNPSAHLVLSTSRGEYKKGRQNISFPKYIRYVDDAADMARIIRGEKPTDFPYEHDLTVQTTLLEASGQPTNK